MKKAITIIIAFCGLFSVIYAQKQPISLDLTDKNSFSFVIYPDPQVYAKYDVNQPIFDLITAWTANNIKRLNIKSVLCVGDLVDQNGVLVTGLNGGNQTGIEQWQSISRSFARLDNRLPYVVCTGNHDYGYLGSENRQSHFAEFFYPERNNKLKDILVGTCPNWQGYHTLENAAYEFDEANWGKMLVVSLEFVPRDEVLEWANKLVSSEKYKNHKVIILTHAYMHTNGNLIESDWYPLTPANYGTVIWERLVYPNPNIKFVLCGHAAVVNGDDFKSNVSYREDKNVAGKTVSQMMFNAQTAGGGWDGNGGDGWIRILEFMPDGKTVNVRTFSPFFAISPTTAKYALRNESYDKFSFVVE